MSAFDCSFILRNLRKDLPADWRPDRPEEGPMAEPRIWPIRLDRPFSPNSSAMTRSALSEAMKFTVSTRWSRPTASSNCRRKIAPLAPVLAIVRFCGGWLGKKPPAEAMGAWPRILEHREALPQKSRRGSQELEADYGQHRESSIPAQRRPVARAGGSGARNPRSGFAPSPQISS